MIKLRTLLIAAGFAFAGSVASAATLVDIVDGNDPFPGDLVYSENGYDIDTPALYKCDDIEENNPSCTDDYANGYSDGTFTVEFDSAYAGTWSWEAADGVSDPVAPHYMVVKAGDSYAIWDLEGDLSGSWTVSVKHAVSHISFYNTGVPEIPVPAAGFLLLGGLGALGFMRRRKG